MPASDCSMQVTHPPTPTTNTNTHQPNSVALLESTGNYIRFFSSKNLDLNSGLQQNQNVKPNTCKMANTSTFSSAIFLV